MSIVFQEELSEMPENLIYGQFEKWDSLRHMSLILALEEEFGFTFSDDDASDLLSTDLIVEIIRDKISN